MLCLAPKLLCFCPHVLIHHFCAGYYRTSTSTELLGCLLIDSQFKVRQGNDGRDIILCNSYRILTLRCENKRHAEEWLWAFRGHYQDTLSPLASTKDSNSFAPPRPGCCAHWYLGGREYFAAVAAGMASARSQIFITDHRISPDMQLTGWPDPVITLSELLAARAGSQSGCPSGRSLFEDMLFFNHLIF